MYTGIVSSGQDISMILVTIQFGFIVGIWFSIDVLIFAQSQFSYKHVSIVTDPLPLSLIWLVTLKSKFPPKGDVYCFKLT